MAKFECGKPQLWDHKIPCKAGCQCKRHSQSEEHRKAIGDAGTRTREQRRASGVYSEASRRGWAELTAEERSRRTTNGRQAIKVKVVARGGGPHISDYGADWLEFRQEILERDKFTCQLALLHRGRPPGKRLEAHHRCFDPGCRIRSHLVTQCSRCHQGGHRRRQFGLDLEIRSLAVGSG